MRITRVGASVLVVLLGAGALLGLACGSEEREAFDTELPGREKPDAGTPSEPGFGDASADAQVISSDPVEVRFTADNAYAFGWGDADSLKNFESRPNTKVFGDIFNCPVLKNGSTCTAPNGCGPEAYTVPAEDAPPTAYLYVVAWSDQMTTQGALGQFKRGDAETLYTGDDAWEVCATGVEHDPSDPADPGPTKADVEAKIALCNAGSGDVVSGGWVNKDGAVTAGAGGRLAVGEDNSAGRASDPNGQPSDGVFAKACQQDQDGNQGIDPEARWMWYQPPAFATAEEAFTDNTANATGTYLIFRVKAVAIPVVPPK